MITNRPESAGILNGADFAAKRGTMKLEFEMGTLLIKEFEMGTLLIKNLKWGHCSLIMPRSGSLTWF
jgi:hypothetical protein